MKSFISKLKSAFGETKVSDHPHNAALTEAIINDVDGAPFAISESNVLYAGLSELAGYHYFKTIIIGTFQTKTFQGATLIINGNDYKLELKSDMVELESESSNIPGRNITRIDFEIDREDVSKISKTAIESIEVFAKKNRVQFSIIEGHYDEGLADQKLEDEESVDKILSNDILNDEQEPQEKEE